jgi:GNAT superfamily N-acetyltransferase
MTPQNSTTPLRRPATTDAMSHAWPPENVPETAQKASALTVSLLEPGDTATLAAIYGRLSPPNLGMRFLTAMPTMPPSLLRRLADCDGYDHVVMVARVAGRPVGEGRYIRTGDRIAEVAGAVVDAWTGRGIAGHLLAVLSDHARHRGLNRFVFTVHTENRTVLTALRRRRAEMDRSNGSAEGHLDLRPSFDHCRTPRPADHVSGARTAQGLQLASGAGGLGTVSPFCTPQRREEGIAP